MEKMNDTMTIYTFAKPDTVTISADKYRELVRKSFGYDALVRVITQGIRAEAHHDYQLSMAGSIAIVNAVAMLEPDKYENRIKALEDMEVRNAEIGNY